jgi:hypothetical protein
MKVKYIYSACLEIDCNGFKILTDPWFTQGAYDGSWFHYPEINPFDHISKPDLIYISHIHPDHYDAVFLKKLYEKFGEIDVLIPDINPNYLFFKATSDGIRVKPSRFFKNDFVEIYIEENDTGSISDIDSALIVKDLKTNEVLLNLNDCIYFEKQVNKLKEIISNITQELDILALGYTGAGPYPQTYIDSSADLELLKKEAAKKKQAFFDRYLEYDKIFNSKVNLPFAGEYLLGGRLAKLNSFRGVADAYELKNFDDKAIILKNGGYIDLTTNEIIDERLSLYDKEDVAKRIQEINQVKYDYQNEIMLPFSKINFLRLIKSAAMKASIKSEISEEYFYIFKLVDDNQNIKKRFVVNVKDGSSNEIKIDQGIDYEKYSEITIDYRYFYGLLSTIYHWDNARIGSHFFTNRVPLDSHHPSFDRYLNFFSIC